MDGDAMLDSESIALLALLQRRDIKWAQIRERIQDVPPSHLLREAVGATLLDDDYDSAVSEARTQVEAWASEGITVTTVQSRDYPPQLRTVHDNPPVVFLKGNRPHHDSRSIAIVGTRTPSVGALNFITDVVPLIARENYSVVSGLARGVDGAAMRASLDSGNRTVGVIGTGIRRFYPSEHRALQEHIAKDHLLLSQFWPDAPPTQQSFPMRNHFMSAYSSMTLIVEAGEKSGTRIQARAATKHARPLIISRAVYLQTTWGKDLVSKGLDVTVVSNAEEAIRAITAISSRQDYSALPSQVKLSPLGV
jgi:DNA processing protein